MSAEVELYVEKLKRTALYLELVKQANGQTKQKIEEPLKY